VWQLLLLWFACIVGVLVFPILVPVVSFTDIAVNSLPFVVMGGAVALVLTRHRDQLERDRAASIRRSALRTAALLRVAERLNSLLDLELLLATMCEEVALALEAQAAIVFLYDDAQAVLVPAGSHGLPAGHVPLASIARAVHTLLVDALGPVATVPPSLALTAFPSAQTLGGPAAASVSYATLAYEGRLVGLLFVIGPSPQHALTEDEQLLLRGLADQSALAIVNTRLYKDARRRLERLQALRTIDIAITSNRDIKSTLDVLLEQITHQLDVDAALVLLLDAAEQRLVFAAGRGFRTQALQATRLRLGEGRAGQGASQRRILVVPDLAGDLGTFTDAPLLGAEGFVSYFAAPLIVKDEVYGVLEVFHRAPLTPGPEWLDFLEALAGQAAIAIDNTTLLSDLQRSHADLAVAYDATIEGWSHALDLRDKETEGHTQRVTEMTLALARRVGRFDESELVHIRRGALLHDIGKMGVPDSILLKPGPLTDAEWVIMRQHPVLAYEMLRVIEYLRPALDIPYAHHEKWDGTGYPRGLQGEQIPLAARLFAIVDIWDALRSDRPYRLAWPEDKVRAHLAGLAGSHLDVELVAVFLNMLETPTAAATRET
jgi:putative nucleotidyltransferase with HDIG domain